MLYKIASAILLFFAIVGSVVCIMTNFDSHYVLLLSFIVYVGIPFIGAISCWKKVASGMILAIMFFTFLSVRTTSSIGDFPYISAFSLSYAFGDFANGQGYLIDLFAIFMALFISYLSKRIVLKSK